MNASAAPLFRVAAGAPPLLLRGLVLRSQTLVDAAEAAVRIEACVFENATAARGGALALTAGVVSVAGATFEGNYAGGRSCTGKG